MAPLRANAIVTCSCGAKWGDISRAARHIDMANLELDIVGSYVPKMVRHWRLNHALSLNPRAPVEFVDVIVRVANQVAEEAAAESGGNSVAAQSTRSLRPSE